MKRPLDAPCKIYKVTLIVVPDNKPQTLTPKSSRQACIKLTPKLKDFIHNATDQPILMIDADFDNYHNERSGKSFFQQVMFAYHETSTRGMLLYICGASDKTMTSVKRVGGDYWMAYVTSRKLDEVVQGDNAFDPDDPLPRDAELIYLSADSDKDIDIHYYSSAEGLGRRRVYIVGGLIDRNRYKGLCLQKARNLRLGHCRLPIAGKLAELGCKVLTTNHVIGVLARHFADGMSWDDALDAVVPMRKVVAAATVAVAAAAHAPAPSNILLNEE